MNQIPVQTSLTRRFQLRTAAPSLQIRVARTASPIVFSRMLNDKPQRGRSISPPAEEAFTFQVPIIPATFSDLRYGGRAIALPPVQVPGRAFLFDLSAYPTVGLETAFDNIRFYISQSAIDDLAYERGMRRVGGLLQKDFGEEDPILFHLAAILLPALENEQLASAAFIEHIGLAFHEHVVRVYGGSETVNSTTGAVLAPWQVRRIKEVIASRLAEDLSISDMAQEVGLSTSHFSRAFRRATGLPPHKWLLRQRVEAAQARLRAGGLTLSEIAFSCGFADQSHLSRAFSAVVGVSPGGVSSTIPVALERNRVHRIA